MPSYPRLSYRDHKQFTILKAERGYSMKKEAARNFWRRHLNLVCNGFSSICVDNPVCGFTVSARAGEYDAMSDEEYGKLVSEYDEYSAIWSAKQRQTAGEILPNALRMTKIGGSAMDSIVETLAASSARSNYQYDPEHDRGPLFQGLHTAYTAEADASLDDWSPREIYDYISQRIHGQNEAKKAAAMAVYNHVEGRRSNVVFCGPSGCGKSEIWRYLAKDLPKLIRIVDASHLSADGWKGSFHLRDIFEGIPTEDLRKRGLIVVLDEADKILCESAIGSGGTNYNSLTQNSLLKMLDGDVVEFGHEEGGRKPFSVDCSRVSVVLLGAFERLIQGKSRASGGIGFGSPMKKECDYSNTVITYDDLINAGMRREIAGRINRIVPLQPLSADDYRKILMGPVLDDLQVAWKCKIEIDARSAEILAEQAISTGLGARWMRSQVVNALDDLMFDDTVAEEYMIKFPTEPRKQESCSFAPTL